MKKRSIALAIGGVLQTFAAAAQPPVPSYWIAPPVFSPVSPGGSDSGGSSVIISAGSGMSGSWTQIDTYPGQGFVVDTPGVVITPIVLPGIDTSASFFPISGLGVDFLPEFNGGTLRIDVSGTYSQDFSITSLGGAIDSYGQTATFTGVFYDATAEGSGPLTITNSLTGGSVTFAGDNSYTGLTTINNGAVLALTSFGGIAASSGLKDNGTFDISNTWYGASVKTLSGNGTVSLGGQTLILTNASSTFTGVISGTGGLLVEGGIETLGGANSYTGLTAISAGASLALTGSGSIAASSRLINEGTFDISNTQSGASITTLSGGGTVKLGTQTLTLTQASDIFYGGIVGSGGLVVAGGSETLGGANSYTGLTAISAGASLALTGVGSIAASSGLTNAGTFDISQGSDAYLKSLAGDGRVYLGANKLSLTQASGSFNGVIDGTGGLAVAVGSETLGGANTYTGLTSINAGASLSLAGAGSIAASSGLVNVGTFDISATQSGATLQTLSGSGSVNLGAQTLSLSNAEGIFSGSIGGAGGLAILQGTELLTGSNTYTGGTSIHAGAFLRLGDGVTDGSIAGDVSNNGTLIFSHPQTAVFGGNISGTGDLIQLGQGNLVLTAIHTYTGMTGIESGTTLALEGAGSIAASSSVLDFGTLDISGTASGAAIKSLTGYGSVNLGAQTLTLTQAADSFSGGFTGTGGLTVAGGTETLTAYRIHDYAGLTTINSGATLALNGAGIIDNHSGVLANGTFDLSGLGTYSAFVATVSGNGTVKLGGNTLFLGEAGGSFGGVIEGDAAQGHLGLVVLSGQETLAGANTYTGLTGIDRGATLALAGGGSIADSAGVGLVGGGRFDLAGASGPVTIDNLFSVASSFINTPSSVVLGANRLTVAHAGATTPYDPFFAGTISGTGGLTVAGGTLVLTGANTYTGGTVINPGAALQLGNGGVTGSIAGDVTDDGSLIFNHSDNVTFGGNITGSGRLLNIGAGNLNLTGHYALGGGGFIDGGVFSVNGSFSGPLAVSAGAVLRGTGVVNGPVNIGGTLAPGNSPGTLTANASVTMAAGSVLQVDIDGLGTGNGAGNYSRLLVNGAGSQFIANGELQPILRGITGNATNTFTPRLGDGFKIVTAQGGIVGRFTGMEQPADLAGGTRFDIFYNAYGNHSIDLYTTPTSYAGFLTRAGANRNGVAVGQAVDRMRGLDASGQASTRQNELRYSVAGLSADQLPLVAQGLAGEVHGAMAAAAPAAGQWLQISVARQLAASTGSQENAGLKAGDTLWVDFNASQGHADGDGYASGYSFNRYQFAVGVDLLHSQDNRFGLGVSYAATSISPRAGSGHIEETAPFLYGQYVFGQSQKVVLDGLFSYGFSTWQTDRADPIRRTAYLHSNADGNSALFGVGIRSAWRVGGVNLEPFARVLWQNNSRNATSEGFASPSALVLTDYSMNGTRALAGLAVGSEKSNPLDAPFTYRASLAFGNDFGNLIHPTVQARLAGESIGINSPQVGRQFGQLNLSASYRIIDSGYAYLGLVGEARGSRLDGGVNAGFAFKF